MVDTSEMSPEERAYRIAVIEGYGGILPYHQMLYREAVTYAARSAAHGFDRFATAILHDQDAVAYLSLQEALTHSAALSRFFWPARKDKLHQIRAEALRLHYAVTEHSPLKARDLRNALEHFDERLDEFLLFDPVGTIVPGPLVMPADVIDGHVGSVFRLVDPISMIFVLFGEPYEFLPIKEEVDRILAVGKTTPD